MPPAFDPRTRYLPPGCPAPEPEALAALRQNIVAGLATPHPPEPAELALIVMADEAGIDLSAIDAREIWLEPAEAREPVFRAIARLLAEIVDG